MNEEGPLHEWRELDEPGLRSWAAQYVGWCTNEMSHPDDLSWKLDEWFDLDVFQSIPTDWKAYFKDEVGDNPDYDENFERTRYQTPVVVSIEGGEVIIWDGWHRIACAIERNDRTIIAIVGMERQAK